MELQDCPKKFTCRVRFVKRTNPWIFRPVSFARFAGSGKIRAEAITTGSIIDGKTVASCHRSIPCHSYLPELQMLRKNSKRKGSYRFSPRPRTDVQTSHTQQLAERRRFLGRIARVNAEIPPCPRAGTGKRSLPGLTPIAKNATPMTLMCQFHVDLSWAKATIRKK